ncbi:MAG: RnfABCDGE type electron transport complex subunit D [Firmicutes bacterium]|nr:RnfABCDGE type electron transport complex subunit D [Bacillota bacterium]
MKFLANPGPYIRGKKSTGQIMFELLIALVVVWIAAIVYNFVAIGSVYGVKAILMVVVSLGVTVLADVLVAAIRYKESKGPIVQYIRGEMAHNYSAITAIIFALTLPIGTPYYVIIVGALFATLIVKYAFGGFGSNIFNPAVMGRIFVAIAFSGSMLNYIGSPAGVPTLISGVTIMTSFAGNGAKWLTDTLPLINGTPLSMLTLYLGTYTAALGEAFTLLILALGVFLAVRRVINWRTPVFYLGTVVLTSIVVALITGLNPLDYSLIAVGMGGLAFGAVFMLTDPVTSPTSPFGKALIGVIAGFITVLIRLQGNLPEGVMYSIAIVNMICPVIDKLAYGYTNAGTLKKWGVVAAVAVCSLGINGGLSAVNAANYNNSSSSSSESSSSSSSSSEPAATVFKTLTGSATSSPDPEVGNMTMTVSVDLDKYYNIIDITFPQAATSGGGFASNWNSHYAAIIQYYKTIGLKGIINAVATPLDATVAGVTVSSDRLFDALKNATSGVSVYTGSATSQADPEVSAQTLNVDVYVENATISTINVYGGITTGGGFATNWNGHYDAVLAYYQGLPVADFLALSATPIDATVAGVTVTSDRLFAAMQNALATYGG